jgi:hypothetical protein
MLWVEGKGMGTCETDDNRRRPRTAAEVIAETEPRLAGSDRFNKLFSARLPMDETGQQYAERWHLRLAIDCSLLPDRLVVITRCNGIASMSDWDRSNHATSLVMIRQLSLISLVLLFMRGGRSMDGSR